MLRFEKLQIGRRVALAAVVALLLAACQAQDAPARAIERYLQAVVAKDSDRVVTASCAAWEEQAKTEIDSFKAVAVTLQDAACRTTGDDGDAKLVACTGAILATYNNENREIPLSGKTYRAVQEGGDWRMCGYK